MDWIGKLIGGALNFFGAKSANDKAAANAQQNRMDQREFAQSGIQWRVEDAKKAGIHPVFALGGGGANFSPVNAVFNNEMSGPAEMAASMGADISRAVTATQSGKQRDATFSEAMNRLSLQRAGLQNQVLAAQLAKLRDNPTPPLPDAAFTVPENPKVEQRPPLMWGGERWGTSSKTSPMKAWEDQYGDEGPVAALMPLEIMWQDIQKNYGPIASWPRQIVERLGRDLKNDFLREGANAKRFFGRR